VILFPPSSQLVISQFHYWLFNYFIPSFFDLQFYLFKNYHSFLRYKSLNKIKILGADVGIEPTFIWLM